MTVSNENQHDLVSLVKSKLDIVDLVILSNLEKSKSDIRRLIYGNAIRLNDKIISDDKLIISDELFSNAF